MDTKNGAERRLDDIEREHRRIKLLYERALSFRERDPETFLMHARKSAEAICRRLFMKHVGSSPRNLTLDGLIERLNASSVLPKAIAIPLRTIQGYGNFAAHDQDADEAAAITPEYIQPCLQALVVVVDWYFTEYHRDVDPPPLQIGSRRADGQKVVDISVRTDSDSHVVSVSDFALRNGMTSAAVIRLARELLHVELRTPSALLAVEQIAILEHHLAAATNQLGRTVPIAKCFELDNGVSMEFVLIPPGFFCMGSPVTEEGHNDDEVEHTVWISRPFYIGRDPVTQAQYRAVLGFNPSYFEGDDHPVEMVSWFDAVSFCELLSERFGKSFRLPTEAEWEYACRGGTTTAFHVGDKLTTDQANFDGRLGPGRSQAGVSRRCTTPVNAFPPNPYGLRDTHGNVWEWCADWYGAYPRGETVDPTGPPRGDIRILRGGSWFHGAFDARSAQRDALDPGRRHSIYGFRVAFNERSK